MDGGNRKIVERVYAAANAGDHSAFAAASHPDAEWHWPRGMADADVCRGAAELE